MIFCHSCGKQIHESAPTCPQCGAVQPAAQVGQTVRSTTSLSAAWLPAVSVGLGALALLALLENSNPDTDTLEGIGIFSVAGIVLGAVGLSKLRPYRNLAMAGLVVSGLALLYALGSAP